MKNKIITVCIASLLLSSTVFASHDCTDPVSQWQAPEQLRQMMTDKGWEVRRIKVDDGCYELKGFDRKGNKVEAKFSPATLKIIELEVKFGDSGDASDYLDFDTQDSLENPAINKPTSNKSKTRPKVSIK